MTMMNYGRISVIVSDIINNIKTDAYKVKCLPLWLPRAAVYTLLENEH